MSFFFFFILYSLFSTCQYLSVPGIGLLYQDTLFAQHFDGIFSLPSIPDWDAKKRLLQCGRRRRKRKREKERESRKKRLL
ncbi:hypothetical protein V8C37DRAFT_208471 [Trichoderma ceciliae]